MLLRHVTVGVGALLTLTPEVNGGRLPALTRKALVDAHARLLSRVAGRPDYVDSVLNDLV